MKNLAKTCFTLIITIGVLGGTYGIYKMVAGNYAMNDPLSFGFILMAYIVLVAGATKITVKKKTEAVKSEN